MSSSEEPSKGQAGAKRIALTLDLGPWADAQIADSILDILEKESIHATLFLAGKFVEKHPEIAERATASGHQLGNHTYSHPDLTKLDRRAIIEELEKTQSLLEKAAGHEITPLYFRPPYGATNSKAAQAVESLGFRSVMWTVEALDWKEGASVEKVIERVTVKAKDGAIVLMHITKVTQEALPVILGKLRAQGFEFVSLEEALKKTKKL